MSGDTSTPNESPIANESNVATAPPADQHSSEFLTGRQLRHVSTLGFDDNDAKDMSLHFISGCRYGTNSSLKAVKMFHKPFETIGFSC